MFVIIKKSEKDRFLRYITSVEANITFTQEESKDNKLAFLNTCVSVKDVHLVSCKVYRKPTHSIHYLQFGPHQTRGDQEFSSTEHMLP